MIRKLVRQMLTAQIFSALTVSLCLLIDNIMIGQYLGVDAIAAYGLANPVLLVIGAIGTMLSAGIQVVCSKSIGLGSQEETNRGYSSAVAVGGGVSLLLMIAVLLLRSPLASAMGAGKSGVLFDMTRSYMAGFIIGAPASMGALILVPFLQMAGQSGLLIAAVLSMTAADVALDFLNVLVLRGGMFGMGLASSLSYYIALLIGAFYFCSKKSVFRFSARLISRAKIAELLKNGVPAVFNMASAVILVFVMNRLLLGVGGSDAVAAYSVLTTLGNSSNCVTTGIGGVSLTLSGVFYHEEDRSALKTLMKTLARCAALLGLTVGLALVICAPVLVKLFLPEPGEAQRMATLGLRLFAAGIIPCSLNNMLKNMYQATGRTLLTEILSLLEGVALPALAAFAMSRIAGADGSWLYFVMGEGLTLLLLCGWIRLRSGRAPWKDGAYLLLRDGFGVDAEHLMEREIRDMRDVTDASRAAEAFCLQHGQGKKLSNHIALCIEEMAGNTVQHGFPRARKERHLSVRVQQKDDHLVLRFRDDCPAFDPVHYIPHEGEDALGIRLVTAMADDIRYTYSMNLNNLTLFLSSDGAGKENT